MEKVTSVHVPKIHNVLHLMEQVELAGSDDVEKLVEVVLDDCEADIVVKIINMVHLENYDLEGVKMVRIMMKPVKVETNEILLQL